MNDKGARYEEQAAVFLEKAGFSIVDRNWACPMGELDIVARKGDTVVKISGGGGGVGPPEQRDPAMVALDVKNEMVSVEAARKIYGVAVDPVTFAVDEAETKRLRAQPPGRWEVAIDEERLAVRIVPAPSA